MHDFNTREDEVIYDIMNRVRELGEGVHHYVDGKNDKVIAPEITITGSELGHISISIHISQDYSIHQIEPSTLFNTGLLIGEIIGKLQGAGQARVGAEPPQRIDVNTLTFPSLKSLGMAVNSLITEQYQKINLEGLSERGRKY